MCPPSRSVVDALVAALAAVFVGVATFLVVAGLGTAFAPEAAGQASEQGDTTGCRGVASTDPAQFFGPAVERTYIYVAPGVIDGDPVEELSDILSDRFEVEVVDEITDLLPTGSERLLIVDDDLGVPGEARLYEGERVTSLYVHWTSAAADVEPLLATAACNRGTGSEDSDDAENEDPETEGPETDKADPTDADQTNADQTNVDRAERQATVPGAAAGVTATWDLASAEAQVLTGYADDVSFDVRLPNGWRAVAPGLFQTDVVASEIGRKDLSLRVDIADRPTDTWSLDDRTNIDFPIDASVFGDGGFEITAQTTTPLISDETCPDAGHVGRWVDIGAPIVTAQIAPGDLDVARTVAGVGTISFLTDQPIAVRIDGDRNDGALLETLGALAAAIGHYGAPAGWHVIDDSTDVASPQGPLIVIRSDPGAPAHTRVTIEDGRSVLTISGDPIDMVALARSMAHPDRLLYFHGVDVSIDAVPASAPATPQEVFGFEAAGYDDRTLRGSGEKSLVYRLHIPAGVPPDRATLALYGTYAPVLAERGATVSVRINGSEEEIVAVADSEARLEVLHTLTAAKLRPGLNYVKVTVDLGVGGIDCSAGPQGWLTLSRSSGLAVELEDDPQSPRLGVEDARFALASTVDFTAADIAIASSQSEHIRQGLVVISELANRADGGAPRLVIDSDHEIDRHLVVVGAAPGRELLENVVPVPLGDRVGLVGAMPSPHTVGRVLLAMTGGSSEAADLAIDAALSARVNDMTAPFALVGLDGVQPVGAGDATIVQPEQLAFVDREPGPAVDDYEAWLLAQASRIESAAQPQVELRRMMAFGLLLVAAVMFGMGWIRRVRQSNTAGSAGGH